MKQVQRNSFISYVFSDQVLWYNIKRFLSYSKNYICKFMQANLWHYKLFHFHLPFWIWKVWKGRKKISKIWISRERTELFELVEQLWIRANNFSGLKADHPLSFRYYPCHSMLMIDNTAIIINEIKFTFFFLQFSF